MKDLLKLLEALARRRPVGILVLGRRGRSCDLFIEEDRVFFAGREYSGRVDMRGLEEKGLLGGRLSHSVMETAIAGTNLVQKPLPRALREVGLITAEECSDLILHHLSEEVFAYTYRPGDSFVFRESEVPEGLLGDDPDMPALELPMLVSYIRARSETASILEGLIPSRKEVFVLTEKGMAHRKAAVEDVGLRRIFDLIDGFRTLNEIIRDVPFFDFYVLSRCMEALQAGHLKKTVLPEIRSVVIGQLDQANAARYLPWFKSAVRHSVDEMGARERLAALYEHLGEMEDAIIQYNFMGDALYRMKKHQRALKAFGRALELRPKDPLLTDKVVKIHQDAAEQSLRDGRRDLAINLLGAALKIKPDSAEITDQLLSLSFESMEMDKVMELCDTLGQRSRTTRDITPALRILRGSVEKFPGETIFRRKIVNLYLDFGMNNEAVAELGELARHEVKLGNTAAAQEFWEKILRIDPSRSDIRRLLKAGAAARQSGRSSVPQGRLKVPGLRLALLLLLAIGLYQYWSYRELEILRRPAMASSRPLPVGSGIERSSREQEAEDAAARVQKFRRWFPASMFRVEALRLETMYREEAERLAHQREKRKEEIYREAMGLAETGSKQEEAVKRLQILLQCPEGDPWRVKAEESIAHLQEYEHTAQELLKTAQKASRAGDWDLAYRSARRLLDEHRLSVILKKVELPVLVRTVPEGAMLSLAGAPLGPSPQRLTIRPAQRAVVKAEAPGFDPLEETIQDDSGPERILTLNRRPGWTVTVGKKLRFHPVVGSELVLVVLEGGTLNALERADGRKRWGYSSGGVVQPVAPPVEVSSSVFLPLNDGQVVRFSQSGQTEARIKPAGLISTPLLKEESLLVFGTSHGRLLGWDLAAGSQRWSLPLKASPPRLAMVSEGRSLICGGRGQLSLLDLESGRTLWESSVGGETFDGDPVALGGVAILRTSGHRVVAADLQSGAVLWRRTLAPPYRIVPLAAHGRFLLLEGGRARENREASILVEVDLRSGREAGRTPLPFAASDAFEAEGHLGVVLASGGYLALDLTTLHPLWIHRRTGGQVTSWAAAGGLLILATSDGQVIAFP